MKRVLSLWIVSLTCILLQMSGVQAQETAPRFETASCPINVPTGRAIECGYLVTREDADDPKSRTIRMAVVIIRSRHANPSKEAMLFTEGGPGESSPQYVWWLANTDFADNRDIVILEQRGNKYADPSLDCGFSIWTDESAGNTPCLDSLRQRGIPLEHYTTASVAADIDALKQVLDYKSWILFGTSYSTRPMQLVMTHYPDRVRGVVLHSTSPLTDTRYLHDTEHAARVLQVMLDDCAADPACASAYPDLEREFRALVRKLNSEPIGLEMNLPGSGAPFALEISGDSLISWMVQDAFYDPAYPPFETAYLPLLIDALSQGNTDLLYPWAKEYLSRWGGDSLAWGLYFAINCQDDASSVRPELVEAQTAAYPELDGYYRSRQELEICAAWGLDPAPPLAREPVISDIPALILAGAYDPITPPEWSRTAVFNLRDSTFVEFPASGHGVLQDNPCAMQITAAFLDDPESKPDLGCLETASRPTFVLPNEIILAPAMYEIHYGELGYSMLEERLFLAGWLTLVGSGAVAGIAGLVKLLRRRKRTPSDFVERVAHPLLILLGFFALGWGYALRFSLQAVAATTPIVLRFGLPVAYWWIFAVAILIGLMTIAVIVSTALAWKRRYGLLIGRVAMSLAALAAITFSGVLAYWGVFTALVR